MNVNQSTSSICHNASAMNTSIGKTFVSPVLNRQQKEFKPVLSDSKLSHRGIDQTKRKALSPFKLNALTISDHLQLASLKEKKKPRSARRKATTTPEKTGCITSRDKSHRYEQCAPRQRPEKENVERKSPENKARLENSADQLHSNTLVLDKSKLMDDSGTFNAQVRALGAQSPIRSISASKRSENSYQDIREMMTETEHDRNTSSKEYYESPRRGDQTPVFSESWLGPNRFTVEPKVQSSPRVLKKHEQKTISYYIDPKHSKKESEQVTSIEPTISTEKHSKSLTKDRSFNESTRSRPEMPSTLSNSAISQRVGLIDCLSKIKWKNPYLKELQAQQRPQIEAAKKIQHYYRIYRQKIYRKKYRWAVLQIQHCFRRFRIQVTMQQSRLREYLKAEEPFYFSARAGELKTLEVDHKLLLEDKSIKESIDKYYESIMSEKEELLPYQGNSVSSRVQQRKRSQEALSSEKDQTTKNAYSDSDLEFFTRIVDLDALTDTREVYEKLWMEQYYYVTDVLSADAPIHGIEVGETFTIAINSKSKIFTWGVEECHLLGVKSSQVQGKFKQIQEEMGSVRLKAIVAAEDHTLALDHASNVYTWGENERGQLGIGIKDKIVYPIKMLTLPKGEVESVAGRGNLNFAVTKKGEVLLWPVPAKLTDKNRLVTGVDVPLHLSLPCKGVSKVVCGYNFAMLVGSNGLAYAMGDNQYGQLGLNDRQRRETPTPIEWLKKKGEKCSAVSCGFKHVVFLSGLGRVYSWGSGHFGQLGHGKQSDALVPQQLHFEFRKFGSKINQVQAGMRASYAMTEDHQLFWWGTNGRVAVQSLPVEVDLFEMFPSSVNFVNRIPVKICAKWCKTMSLTYLTVGKFSKPQPNTLSLKRKTLANLGKRWEDHHVDPPQMYGLDKNFKTEYSKELTLIDMKKWNNISRRTSPEPTRHRGVTNVSPPRYITPRDTSATCSRKQSQERPNSSRITRSQQTGSKSPSRNVPKQLTGREMPLNLPFGFQVQDLSLESAGCGNHHSYARQSPPRKRYDETELKLLELKRKYKEISKKSESIWSPAQYNFMSVMKEPQMASLLARFDSDEA